jgi:hypothetical protein
MKDWQHGYDLERLVEIQDNSFRTFNSLVLNPFLVMKKNRVAEALHKSELQIKEGGGMRFLRLKSGGPISMFTGYKIPILKKKAGDVLVKCLSPSDSEAENVELCDNLKRLAESANVLLFIHDECTKSKEMAEGCGFEFKARQFNTFADVFSIYYKGTPRKVLKVNHAQFHTLEKASIPNIGAFIICIREILLRLEDEKVVEFTNHYSNYNEGNTWSAISLRGYSSDWRFIEKPSEMNKKWKAENKGKSFWLQDTDLMEHFEDKEGRFSCDNGNLIYGLLNHIGVDSTPHRIRFMKLRGGEGTLGRHTDQVCPDTGVDDGDLMRLHFPILTNEAVKFKCWHSKDCTEVVMREGECWYLDTRKPHEATNGGDSDRVHLVIDVPATVKLRGLFQ